MVEYDEFSMFADNASEHGIAYDGPPVVRRESVDLGDGRHLSGLVWGTESPEIVFFHGGAQNAHTWDTVALALGRPILCLDLPGHGHSGSPASGSRNVARNAADVALAVEALAPNAKAVVGMSMGGLTAITLSGLRPDLVAKLVLVDITPGVTAEKAQAITAFVKGPESFQSFDDLLARTMEFNPTRTEASLRRGILHNAEQRPDGSWVWRYARHRANEPTEESGDGALDDVTKLWDVLDDSTTPLLLVRGMRSGSVVDDADEAELKQRRPDAEVIQVVEAGHSIQGDDPVRLAEIIDTFVG